MIPPDAAALFILLIINMAGEPNLTTHPMKECPPREEFTSTMEQMIKDKAIKDWQAQCVLLKKPGTEL